MHNLKHSVAVKDDVRYSEFLFLRDVEKNPLNYFNPNDQKQQQNTGLGQVMLIEMVLDLLEGLYIHPNQEVVQRLVYQMRGDTQRNAGMSRE
jgi:hypothetical protein